MTCNLDVALEDDAVFGLLSEPLTLVTFSEIEISAALVGADTQAVLQENPIVATLEC